MPTLVTIAQILAFALPITALVIAIHREHMAVLDVKRALTMVAFDIDSLCGHVAEIAREKTAKSPAASQSNKWAMVGGSPPISMYQPWEKGFGNASKAALSTGGTQEAKNVSTTDFDRHVVWAIETNAARAAEIASLGVALDKLTRMIKQDIEAAMPAPTVEANNPAQ